LFGENLQISCFDEMECFQGAGGGESPARTTLALVLDRGQGMTPVH